MRTRTKTIRRRAASMAIAAYLDDEYAEMRIVTEFGERMAIVYDRDSIFAVMRHIQQIARDCPEIST